MLIDRNFDEARRLDDLYRRKRELENSIDKIKEELKEVEFEIDELEVK